MKARVVVHGVQAGHPAARGVRHPGAHPVADRDAPVEAHGKYYIAHTRHGSGDSRCGGADYAGPPPLVVQLEALATLRPDWEQVLHIDPDSVVLGSGSIAQVSSTYLTPSHLMQQAPRVLGQAAGVWRHDGRCCCFWLLLLVRRCIVARRR